VVVLGSVVKAQADTVGCESPGESRRMCFLSRHELSVEMCLTAERFAWLQLKHHRGQSQPGIEWQH